jgi:hypothetical protein
MLLCATLAACAGPIEEQMGPQSFSEASVGTAGGGDAQVLAAVESAVHVAQKHAFHYDASASANGRVVVRALWRGRPVTLTMRFFRQGDTLRIASSLDQPGDLFLEGAGQKIEELFYSELAAETARRGLQITGDPSARP